MIETFKARDARWEAWQRRPACADFCEKWWFADVATLRANDFNLSAGRYRPMNQSAHVRRELGKLSSGTSASVRNISQAKLYQLPLPIAPYSMQKAFAERSAMVAIRSQQTAATARAQAAFDALLAKCFSPLAEA